MGKKIGLGTAVITGMNAMIGAGIVSMPGLLMKDGGVGALYVLGFGLVLALCLGASLARLQQLYPQASWSWDFPKLWGGTFVAYVTSVSYILGLVFAMSFLLQQTGIWCEALWGGDPFVWSLGTIILIAGAIMGGIQLASWAQMVIALGVFVPLLFTSFLCWQHVSLPAMPSLPSWEHFTGILPKVMFAFLGFECSLSLVSLMKQSGSGFYALLLSIFFVGIFYINFIASTMLSVPSDLWSLEPLGVLLTRAFPESSWVSIALSIGALFGLVGTVFSMVWSLSQLVVHACFGSSLHSWQGRGVTGAFSFVITMVGLMGTTALIQWSSLLIVGSFLLASLGLLREKSEWKNGFNVIALAGVSAASLMVYYAALDLFHYLMP